MEDSRDKLDFDTKVIHAGQEPEKLQVRSFPDFCNVNLQAEISGVHTGYEYARTQNPTREKLEACIAALKNVNLEFLSHLVSSWSINPRHAFCKFTYNST